MNTELRTSDGDSAAVIVRAFSVNYDKPPEWQDRRSYAMQHERRAAVLEAIGPRVQAWMHDQLLDELFANPDVASRRNVVATRHYGQYGFLEVSIIEARGQLAARYLAVSRLPEFERDVYLDALIDDHLANHDVAQVDVGERQEAATAAAAGPAVSAL